ncbi:Molybdopterin binding protein [Neocallimastix sp. 'constans']|jgi:molybdenum cofactor synthesis domain-containing protein
MSSLAIQFLTKKTITHSLQGIKSQLLLSSRKFASKPPRTVAACIIGDEILSGRIADTNAHFLAKECFNRGLDLKKIIIVPDDMNDIGDAVTKLSNKYDLVFTSGGIGPTHDDITYEAIANAFDLKLEKHQPTIERMLNHGFLREDSILLRLPEIPNKPKPRLLNAARLRMATLPTPCSVMFPCDNLWVPLVTVNNNVSILPGVPHLFENMIIPYINKVAGKVNSNFGNDTYDKRAKFFRQMIGSNLFEADLAPILREAQMEINKKKLGIKIGSYPKWRPSPKDDDEKDMHSDNIQEKSNVLITFVGRNEEEVKKWKEIVKEKIGGFEVPDEESKFK